MSPLLAPLFAQLVSLQLGDRTEGRYIDLQGTKLYEVATLPSVALRVSERHTQVQTSYRPILVLSPIESESRQLYAFHALAASVGYVLPRTTLTLGSVFGIGSQNLRLAGLQGQPAGKVDATTAGTPNNAGTPATSGMPSAGTPATGPPGGGGTPTTPGGALTRETGVNQKVRFYTSTTTLNLSQRLTRDALVAVTAGSTTTNGQDESSRLIYPRLHGWTLGGNTSYTYVYSRRERFVGTASLIKTWSSNDNEAALLNALVTWAHRFDPRTSSTVGAGINVTRFSQSDGLAGFSIFPTVNLGVTHQVPVGRGGLSFTAGAFSSPVLDPLRALVDPRLGFNANVGYTRKKLFMTMNGSTAFSLAPSDNSAGAVNFVQAEARAGYQIEDLTALDTGVRLTRQTYAGQTVVPTSWAAFVGLTLGYDATLAGRR